MPIPDFTHRGVDQIRLANVDDLDVGARPAAAALVDLCGRCPFQNLLPAPPQMHFGAMRRKMAGDPFAWRPCPHP